MIKRLKEIEDFISLKTPKRVAVAAAHEENVLCSVKVVSSKGYIIPVLIGNKEKICEIAECIEFNISGMEIIDEQNDICSANLAVDLVKSGDAHALMKGRISTADLMKVVMDKENGFWMNHLVSNIQIVEHPCYPKLLLVTDPAINISPDLKQKMGIIENAVYVAHKLGIETPKVAVLAAIETVNASMPCTMEAAILSKMCDRGQFSGCIVDGPLSLDLAINAESVRHKNVISEVAGDADVLMAPNIESANVLFKSLTALQKCTACSIIAGTKFPVIITSRSDTVETKYYSILMTLALCGKD